MKFTLLTIFFISFMGTITAQEKMKKCMKLVETEQKVCKDNLLSQIIADYVEYPESAMENLNEGIVFVRFATDENQNLKSVRVLGESDKELGTAAQKAVETFFEAEGKNLLAQNEVYRIPVKFELD